MIKLSGISHHYGRRATVLSEVSFNIAPGRVLALLGPNGAGKSTLLKIIAGEFRPSVGKVDFQGKDLFSIRALELARIRALLPQDSQLDFPFSVEEVVLLGRSPHMDGFEKEGDVKIALEALDMVGMGAFRFREYPTLSGGERQRVQLARVLAQVWDAEKSVLLLDEPVSSLDPEHQHETLAIARKWASAGAAVVAILHDVNLALRYADDAVLLKNGRVVADGHAKDVLTASRVSEVFNVQAQRVQQPQGEPPMLALKGR